MILYQVKSLEQETWVITDTHKMAITTALARFELENPLMFKHAAYMRIQSRFKQFDMETRYHPSEYKLVEDACIASGKLVERIDLLLPKGVG